MGDGTGCGHRLDREARLEALEAVPQSLAAAEHDRYQNEVHVVDQVGFEELAHGRRAAADAYVEPARGFAGGGERCGRAGVDEVKARATLHLDRWARMVGQHEHRRMEGRVLAPPAPPLFVGPRSVLRAELAAAHDLCADARVPAPGEGVIRTEASAGFALHLAEGARLEEPLVQAHAGMSERSVEGLPVTRAVTVEGNAEVVDADQRHTPPYRSLGQRYNPGSHSHGLLQGRYGAHGMLTPMFERFSEDAEQAVADAQEAARGLGHKHVGTEHLLLGLLADERLVSARALSAFDLSYDGVRAQVVAKVGTGHEPTEGEIAFTAQAQKAFELSVRESLRLGHDYVGTGHLLLGLAHGKDTLSSQILRPVGADLRALRECTEPLIPQTATQLPVRAAALPMPEPRAVSFTIAPDPQLSGLLMIAGSRALADARQQIGVADVIEALWDDPEARQLLIGRQRPAPD